MFNVYSSKNSEGCPEKVPAQGDPWTQGNKTVAKALRGIEYASWNSAGIALRFDRARKIPVTTN